MIFDIIWPERIIDDDRNRTDHFVIEGLSCMLFNACIDKGILLKVLQYLQAATSVISGYL